MLPTTRGHLRTTLHGKRHRLMDPPVDDCEDDNQGVEIDNGQHRTNDAHKNGISSLSVLHMPNNDQPKA